MKRRQTYAWMPYTYVQRASMRERAAMAEAIKEENTFQAQEFDPAWTDETMPEWRELIRNSSGWAVKVTVYFEHGKSYDYEQFARCKICRTVTLLAGGCSFCWGCGVLLEDDN